MSQLTKPLAVVAAAREYIRARKHRKEVFERKPSARAGQQVNAQWQQDYNDANTEVKRLRQNLEIAVEEL